MKNIIKVFVAFFMILAVWFIYPQKNNAQVLNLENPDRLIVKFHSLTPKYFKNKTVEKYGLSLKEEIKLPNSYVVEVPKGKISEYRDNLGKSKLVDYIEEDYLATKFEIPNDPYYPNQWGLEKIQAPGAWDISHSNSGVDIAIIDTGINYLHPDLGSKVEYSVDCRVGSCPNYLTQDPDGHGTHVAGIVGAITHNSLGVAGVSWGADLFSVKVLNDDGSGYYSWIANGIVWAADNGAEIINISLGGSSSSSTLASAINYAWNKGTVIVAASGNRGTSSPTYPAYYSNSIAVAATSQNDVKASFSNYGTWVDVAAPGVSIYSSYGGSYNYLSGTSMSAPLVSGLASLIKAKNPTYSNLEIRQTIESSSNAIMGTGSYWRFGRINACKALGCSEIQVTPTPVTTAQPTLASTVTPTPSLTTVPTSIPIITLVPTINPTPTNTPTPTPSISPLPWWCKYVPSHPTCL